MCCLYCRSSETSLTSDKNELLLQKKMQLVREVASKLLLVETLCLTEKSAYNEASALLSYVLGFNPLTRSVTESIELNDTVRISTEPLFRVNWTLHHNKFLTYRSNTILKNTFDGELRENH